MNMKYRLNKRRIVIAAICTIICIVMLYVLFMAGDCGCKEKDDARAYIIENHNADTGAKNAVTAIYLNYRLFDTFFEAMLLMLSAMAVIAFSWSSDDEK